MAKKISDLVSLALERTHKGTSGFEFENFAQNLSRCQLGDKFFATSPFKDDGIDGFKIRINEETVVTKSSRPDIIYQYGTTEKFLEKIKGTFQDLKDKGISVTKINYYSPRSISQITKHTTALEEELDISIKIIDQAQLCTMAANNECSHIFKEFIGTMLGSIEPEDDTNLMIDYSALYLSAWYRYENKTENNKTITNVTDSLIIWALRDTDPVKNIFMSKDDIYYSIEKEFPTARTSVKSIFNDRLNFLNKLKTEFSRQSIQKHKNMYCLPVETREDFRQKNEESHHILLLAKIDFTARIEGKYTEQQKEEIVDLILHTLKHVFTKQGMKLTRNIMDTKEDSYDDINLRDAINCACEDLDKYSFQEKNKEAVAKVLRQVFAKPLPSEQEYLTRASYLYIMNYVMHNNMDVISYFKERTKRLNLIVHSDILIHAISEQYLPKEGQHYRNMIAYLNDMGANLIVTEESITEIYKNLRIASLEYKNNIQTFEGSFSLDSIRYMPILMTRAYMYNKRAGLVDSWEEFIFNFCTPNNLHGGKHSAAAKEELKVYLSDKFKLDILTTKKLEDSINTKLAAELTEIIKPYKKKDEIAKHVSNVNIYISTIRNTNKEVSSSPFGYQTYWLTSEKTVYNIAERFFNDNELGSRLIMRPEFVIQQIMFTPDSKSVAESYTSTFPTALGIQLSQQLDSDTFRGLMSKLNSMNKVDNSRAKAILNEVIQVAAEKTQLTHFSNNYEFIEVSEKGLPGAPRNLQCQLEEIFNQATQRFDGIIM